jgi:hypothetical protein
MGIFHQLTLKSIGVRESTHSPSMKFLKTRAWVSLRVAELGIASVAMISHD